MVEHNIHYKHDINYTLQLCQWVLKPMGMWPFIYGHASRNEKLISSALIVTCLFILCFVVIPSGLHIFLYEKDIHVKVKLCGPVDFCLTCIIKYCYLGARSTAFGKCIRDVENDWRTVQYQDYRKMMLKASLISRRLTILCAIFFYTGGMSYHTILTLTSKQIGENVTDRSLTYPGNTLFFDSQASPAYEIVFCIHCLSVIIQYSVTTTVCSLTAIFAAHTSGQLQILMTMLNDLVDGKRNNNTTLEKRLGDITRYHVRILRFSANVEETLREICLLEMVASTLIICLLEYYCLTEWKNSDTTVILTYFILLISFTCNTLIFCYIGELLVQQYNKIGSAVYNINWYDLPGNKALSLVLSSRCLIIHLNLQLAKLSIYLFTHLVAYLERP